MIVTRSLSACPDIGVESTMCDQIQFEYLSLIRGHHIYKDIFMPTIGKTQDCRREASNSHDPYAVATIENDIDVGHVPRNISVPYSLLLRRGGSISCVITGARQHSSDLAQGGLEVPCKLVFNGPVKDIGKLQSLLQRAPKLPGNGEDKANHKECNQMQVGVAQASIAQAGVDHNASSP